MSEYLSYGALARIYDEPSFDELDNWMRVDMILQVLSVEPSSSSRFVKYLESYLTLKLISNVQLRATAE